ncbi:MAG TPA: hypothetical protein VIA18_26405 [Polyangia bacterium]|jgi:hypothetical protein|nr:hypothetical protein [Polyangia bacterium]
MGLLKLPLSDTMTPAIFAKRILNRIPRYIALPERDWPAWADLPSPAMDDEQVLGIYQNQEKSVAGGLVITSERLYLRNGDSWACSSYKDMVDVECFEPGLEKSENDSIIVTLRDHSKLVVPVRGRDGRFADVFEFCRFLMRVSTHSR